MSGSTHSVSTIPLFPLHSIVFPGGVLPLRIFEPRYLDMISRCLRDDSGFGICMIRSGQDTGETPEINGIGVVVRVVDWERLDNGMLGISAQGQRKFHVLSTQVEKDKLMIGQVQWLEPEPCVPVPDTSAALSELLRRIVKQLPKAYTQLQVDFDDAASVGGRLCELLPFDPAFKQRMLELDDPIARLDTLRGELKSGLLA